MTTNIVLPPLTTWAEQHISSILKSTTQAAFDAAFEAFIAKSPNITVNGAHITRAQYKTLLQGQVLGEAAASITFSGVVGVPKNKDQPIDAGSVGLFYEAIIAEKFLILGAPEENKLTSSLNIAIEQDPSLHHPTGPIRGFFDGRRALTINQVLVDNPVPISLPTAEPTA